MSKKRARIDEGCGIDYLIGASFVGNLEIPCVKGAGKITAPELILPFSLRNKKRDPKKYILLSEPDVDFNDIILTLKGGGRAQAQKTGGGILGSILGKVLGGTR